MRRRVIAAVTASLLLAAVVPALAQGQLPRPGQLPPAGRPGAPQAAAKPYKAVAITAPTPVNDPSLEAFRKQVAAAAEKKDRAALAGMVVQNFFWMGEKGDIADKNKAGIDNLAKALPLDPKSDDGWQKLAGMASDPTGMAFPQRKDTLCSPAYPSFNEREFEALMNSTGSEDWAFPFQPNVEVRSGPQPNSPVIDKLGMNFVRIVQSNEQMPVMKVVTPSGKTGYVPAETLGSLADDQICYGKDGGGWKIVGYVGGEP
jgi:hypothetical protein